MSLSNKEPALGSAVVDFILVSIPMLLIGISTIGITLTSYSRTVLIDAASEGARFGSLADQDLASGISKASQQIAASLGPNFPFSINGREYLVGSIKSIEISIETTIPGIGLLPGGSVMLIQAGATVETTY